MYAGADTSVVLRKHAYNVVKVSGIEFNEYGIL
jgi:hypothetical protein